MPLKQKGHFVGNINESMTFLFYEIVTAYERKSHFTETLKAILKRPRFGERELDNVFLSNFKYPGYHEHKLQTPNQTHPSTNSTSLRSSSPNNWKIAPLQQPKINISLSKSLCSFHQTFPERVFSAGPVLTCDEVGHTGFGGWRFWRIACGGGIAKNSPDNVRYLWKGRTGEDWFD